MGVFMNIYLKRLIIVLSLFTFLSFSFNPKKADAIVGVDDCILIGGVLIATSVVVSLMIKSGNYDGYEVNNDYSFDLRNYLSKKILALSAAEIAQYFFTAKDSEGNNYAGLTDSGTTYSREELKELFNIEVNNVPVTTTKTTDKTTYVDPFTPFMLNGFYMEPYHTLPSNGIYNSFKISYGDTVSFLCYSTLNPSITGSASFTPINDCYIKIDSYTGSAITFRYSYNNSSWTLIKLNNGSINYINTNSSAINFIGYKTVSNTVYVPGSQVISQGTSIDKPADSVVAVPISGQYASDGTTRIYDGIEGGVATAVTGLKAADLSTGANTGANTGEGTQTGFWDSLWDWLQNIIDGIKAIPKLILDWFTIDWDRVKTHINYVDIVKSHLGPIYDLFNLVSNMPSYIQNSDGKFYMVIPAVMGGDGQEHCVLDLSVGSSYISLARDIIKYGMWITLLWYIFRKFEPKFSI